MGPCHVIHCRDYLLPLRCLQDTVNIIYFFLGIVYIVVKWGGRGRTQIFEIPVLIKHCDIYGSCGFWMLVETSWDPHSGARQEEEADANCAFLGCKSGGDW